MQTIVEEESWKVDESERRISRDPRRDLLIREVGNGWNEYVNDIGRSYYHNAESGETTWKPPRMNLLTHVTILRKKKKESKFGSGTLPTSRFSSERKSSLQDAYEVTEGRAPYDEAAAKVEKEKYVGRLLKTGILNTSLVRKCGAKRKRWVSSYVALTEYYIIFTPQLRFIQKLFWKAKAQQVVKFYIPEVFVRREMLLSKKSNVFRITARSHQILVGSENQMEAEMWYQILKLMCSQFDDKAMSLPSLAQLVIPNLEERGFSVVSDSAEASLSRSSSLSPLHSKRSAPPGWIDRYDPNTGRFYYVNSVTGRKWFSELSVDGENFFFEEGTGRASWILPPVYPDVDSRTFKVIPVGETAKSTTFLKMSLDVFAYVTQYSDEDRE